MPSSAHPPATARLTLTLVSAAVSLALAASPMAHSKPADISLEAAAQALREGDAARAAMLYETLAQRGESIEAEVGLVRTLLLTGEFRKAVSFANLTAGEHPESAEAQALLAFVNDRTGRTEQALAALKKLEAASPREWAPVAVHAEILIDRLAPKQAQTLIAAWTNAHPTPRVPELERLLARANVALDGNAPGTAPSLTQSTATSLTPISWLASTQPLPIAGRRIVGAGNGVIIDGGKSVLTFAPNRFTHAKTVWVRNAFGHARQAHVERSDKATTFVRLRLDEPFPANAAVPSDQVSSPEGVRFCFALGFSTPRSPDGAYPAISPGIVFRADTGVDGLIQVTSALGPEQNGAPVFDARGKLIGLALGDAGYSVKGQDIRNTLGRGHFALRVDEALTGVPHKPRGPLTPAGKEPPMPAVEELFERLAPAVVQIVALD